MILCALLFWEEAMVGIGLTYASQGIAMVVAGIDPGCRLGEAWKSELSTRLMGIK